MAASVPVNKISDDYFVSVKERNICVHPLCFRLEYGFVLILL